MDKKIQRAFEDVRADEALKDGAAAFLHEKLYARTRRTALRRAVPAVCCALLLLFALTGYGVYSMPVAAISVEAGETVELKVNAFDRVVSYTCLSSGGEDAVDALNLTHQTYSDAVAALVEDSSEAAVSVAADSAEKSAAITAEIETRCAGVACQSADAETLEAAAEAGPAIVVPEVGVGIVADALVAGGRPPVPAVCGHAVPADVEAAVLHLRGAFVGVVEVAVGHVHHVELAV